jgi:hypothetical protein
MKAGTIAEHGEKARQFVRDNDWGTVVDDFEEVLLDCARPPEDGACDGATSTRNLASFQGQQRE